MNVLVEIDLPERPTNEVAESMREAAGEFTGDSSNIRIAVPKSRRNMIAARFKMKTTAQYKVVDNIADAFKDYVPDYEDISITFSK
jgi:hypothetical protein